LDLAEKRLAVLRVADRARRHRERAFRAERLELAAVVGQRVADARDRQRQKPTAGVDAFAEPRDARPSNQLVDTAVHDVGDEPAAAVNARNDRHARSPRSAATVAEPASATTRKSSELQARSAIRAIVTTMPTHPRGATIDAASRGGAVR